jgi:hypothetical protein
MEERTASTRFFQQRKLLYYFSAGAAVGDPWAIEDERKILAEAVPPGKHPTEAKAKNRVSINKKHFFYGL